MGLKLCFSLNTMIEKEQQAIQEDPNSDEGKARGRWKIKS